MSRGTGGGRFLPADATRGDLVAAVARGLDELHAVADASGRRLDLGEVTIDTKRIPSGKISVSVMADLATTPPMR